MKRKFYEQNTDDESISETNSDELDSVESEQEVEKEDIQLLLHGEKQDEGITHPKLLKAVHSFSKDEERRSHNSSAIEQNSISGLSLEMLTNSEHTNVSNGDSAIPSRMENSITQKIERQHTYETNKVEINRWHDAVISNRYSKNLDFANDQRLPPPSRSLVKQFLPSSSLERAIHESGLASEFNESVISFDEMKRRQNELAKINSMLFYEQIKRHRINKIKSKTYRSIRRKQERRGKEMVVTEAENGDGRELQERDVELQQLDANLRYKNTSKCAQDTVIQTKSLRENYNELVERKSAITKRSNEASHSKEEVCEGDVHLTEKFEKLIDMDFMKRAMRNQSRSSTESALEAFRDSVLEKSLLEEGNSHKSVFAHSIANSESQSNLVSRQKNSTEINPWTSTETPTVNVSNSFECHSSIPNFVSPADHEPKNAPLAIINRSQTELVELAFCSPPIEEEFENLKRQFIDEEHGLKEKTMEALRSVKAGWGDWAGPERLCNRTILQKRQQAIAKMNSEEKRRFSQRKDFDKEGLILSEKRIKSAAKFKISKLPFPFTSKEEYQRSLQVPVGDEWNSSHVVKGLTAPEVKVRAGRIIQPLDRITKKSREEG